MGGVMDRELQRLKRGVSRSMSLSESLESALEERRGYPVGTIRVWRRGGQEIRMKKTGHKEWVPVTRVQRQVGKDLESSRGKLAQALQQGFVEKGGKRLSLSDETRSMSLEEHERDARRFLGQHKETLDRNINDLRELFPDADVYGRVKDLHSALGKIIRKPEKYSKVSDLDDGGGMRVVRKSLADVQEAVAEIRKRFRVVGENDYLNGHPANGDYRSFHMIIERDGKQQEIQVRTGNQDRWGDWFHDLYKPRTQEQAEFARKNRKTLDRYSSDISSYFFARDQGKRAKKPPCPEVVGPTVGCL
jgi:ppGpp synthetase/RelA/SpoT-type nucleotidyltranferase